MLLQPANPTWALTLLINGMPLHPCTITMSAAACQTCATPLNC